MAEQDINVVITADDSGIIGAFAEVQESAEELEDTMGDVGDAIDDAFTPPRNIKATNAAIKQNTKELKKNEVQTNKNTRASGKFVKQGGRGVSMLSRLSGVGGKAASSLGGVAFALGSTPFGPFALAAAAATVAYSFFADKLGLNNDEIIKKNKELSDSILLLEGQLDTAFRSRQIAAIDLDNISEAQKRTEKLAVFQELLSNQERDRFKLFDDNRKKQNAAALAEGKTDTKSLEAIQEYLKSNIEVEKATSGILSTKNKIAQLDKDAVNEAKAAAAQQEANAKAAQKLLDGLIRGERERAILQLKNQADAREENAKGVFKTKEKENAFILQSQTILKEDLKELNAQFDAAELKARQALLTQFVIDEEKAALENIKNKSAERDVEIQNLKATDEEKAVFTKQNAEKLEVELQAIRDKFAEQRKAKGLAQQQEFFDAESVKLEANIMRETAILEQRQEIARQAFAGITRTEEEITDFKKIQDDEKLKLELSFQIERLKLIKQFNKQITEAETASLDAQIANLETKLKGVGTNIQKQGKDAAQKGDGLFGLLGIDSDTQSDIQAVQGALEQVTSAVSAAVAERVALLQKEVDARTKRVEEIQNDLANEIELNKLGKASNIAELQEQLASEKAARDKAEKDKKDAAEAQFAIDTALQASNLVTAISGLYSSLSGLPFGIGVALATALSAVLIGTFIASKTSAASAAGFAEGGQYGYTGDGAKYQKSNRLGEKPYDYHRGEYILDAETTKDLGIDGMHMSDARSHLLGIPSTDSSKRRNKAINKAIDTNTSESRKRQEKQLNNGIEAALSKSNQLLSKIYKKPTVVQLGEGKALLKYPDGSSEIIKMK